MSPMRAGSLALVRNGHYDRIILGTIRQISIPFFLGFTRGEKPKLEDNEIQWSMAFTPDGTRLVSGGNAKVNIWDVRKHRKLHALAIAGNGYIQSLAVSPDNKLVAAIPSSAGQDLQVFGLGTADK
jgi:WD40 repeat protein